MEKTNNKKHFVNWRRFRPGRAVPLQLQVRKLRVKSDMYSDVGDYVARRLPHRRPKPQQLDNLIRQFRGRAEATDRPEDWLAALLIQAPRAAVAQQELDKYPRGYHDKKAHVFELIDFNDAFVSTVLAMDEPLRELFDMRAKEQCDRMCMVTHSPMFTDEQWRAIVRGLTREIAVYQAARERGFDAFMPNRTADAMGIDLQVRDPESGRYINLDVKTPSSYRHRLEELVQEGRLTESGLMQADERSYAIETNGHNGGSVKVILLCMLPDKFGEFGHFRLQNSEPMRQMLNFLIREYGIDDDRYGIYR